MNRRGVLIGAAAGTAALLGVGALGLRSSDDPVRAREFERRRPEGDEHAAERPSVTFEPRENRISVTGVLVLGSDDCLRAALASATHDAEAGTFEVVVAAEPDDALDGCEDGTAAANDAVVTGSTGGENDSVSANWSATWSANDSDPQPVPEGLTVDGYDAAFEFDGEMPAVVVVTERDDVYGERTTRVEWALG
ncbi:hypothetical protein [Haloprofundus salilacus]|uniref:hypothetical protein n=1 Tax=Haloprofundus salilacus TaxID=2876190 RepID=UPI001CCA77D9|nr:hypothetical protein [Haloprofundus salilacus]